jgi:hypothetical protein
VSAGCRRTAEAVAALLASTREVNGEILLPDSSNDGSASSVPDSTRVRRIPVRAGANAASLREAGILESAGPIVALVEPWAIAAPAWGRAILEAHARTGDVAVVGGPVLYGGSGRAASWAEFLFEYGAFLPPMPAVVSELPVNNVSYPRALLERFRTAWTGGFWKHFVHRRMREAGVRFIADPAAAVRHAREVPFLKFCGERVQHGRAYAARSESGPWRALLAPLLPVLLASRIARTVWGRAGARNPLVRSLPFLLAAQGAWAFGEAVGCLTGDGGSSSRVF